MSDQATPRFPLLPPEEQKRRRAALAAAERSGMMEGLPPVSAFARRVGERFIRGEIPVDQAVAIVLSHYRRAQQ